MRSTNLRQIAYLLRYTTFDFLPYKTFVATKILLFFSYIFSGRIFIFIMILSFSIIAFFNLKFFFCLKILFQLTSTIIVIKYDNFRDKFYRRFDIPGTEKIF